MEIVLKSNPEKRFTPKWSYPRLFALAQRICDSYRSDELIGLNNPQRGLVGAALLAAFAGGPKLVVPYSTEPDVSSEAIRLTATNHSLQPHGLLDEGLLPRDQKELWPSSFGFCVKNEPCVFLFTGGSSARPKVWGKSAANLLDETYLLASLFAVTADDKILSSVPPLHIYGLLFSVLLPLITQAQVWQKTLFLPAEIACLLQEYRPTILVSGPVHLRALHKTRLQAGRVRLTFSSGGMLEPDDAERFSKQCEIGVTEVFGSTETGGIAIRNRFLGQQDWTPMPSVQCRQQQERLSVRSPFLSAELPTDAAGFFTTADRVCMMSDGRFRLLGRADGIVKVAGKRVDLLEVEQHIRALGADHDACLVPRYHPKRMCELVALVVGPTTTQALKRILAKKVPAYAIPRKWIRLEQIPRTVAGKVDREQVEKIVNQCENQTKRG